MRPFPCRLLAVLGPVLFATPLANAYPIPPVTLWELTEQADLIVVARVGAVESVGHDGDDMHRDRDTARLEVLEVWKGSVGAEVSVTFTRGMICPAPPRYVPGETVLAFLESHTTRLGSLDKRVPADQLHKLAAEWKDRWFTVGLSYGTLYPEADDRPFLRDFVDDAMVLQSQPEASEAQRRAWLVRAATRRVTRWQGLYALDRRSDEVHSFYDRKQGRPSSPSADERREVMRGFILEPSDDHTLIMTLSFVGAEPEPEFDRAVLGQVERLLLEPRSPHWLGEALARMAERYGSANGRQEMGLEKKRDQPGADPLLRAVLARDDWEPPNALALRPAWARVRERYGIPEVPPAPAPPRQVRGTGGMTPP